MNEVQYEFAERCTLIYENQIILQWTIVDLEENKMKLKE